MRFTVFMGGVKMAGGVAWFEREVGLAQEAAGD
jgi:hypothetical protein